MFLVSCFLFLYLFTVIRLNKLSADSKWRSIYLFVALVFIRLAVNWRGVCSSGRSLKMRTTTVPAG